jgi:hypothetical protein
MHQGVARGQSAADHLGSGPVGPGGIMLVDLAAQVSSTVLTDMATNIGQQWCSVMRGRDVGTIAQMDRVKCVPPANEVFTTMVD